MIPRYQSIDIERIWSIENRYREWFRVEIAYLKAYFKYHDLVDDGLITRLQGHLVSLNWRDFAARVAAIEKDTHHDVIAFLQALEEVLGDDARLIHIGLTSSDVVDTAFAGLLLKAAQQILDQLQGFIDSLWRKADQYRGVLSLGRTHGQSAEPTTFGLKLLSHLCEFVRSYERILEATRDIQTGKLSGAVGVYAHTDPAIEHAALEALGLTPETIATQVVARDRHAHFFATLAVLAGSIERLSTEIRLLMHGEVREVFEPFGQHQKGSSAMPHKKNPVLSENLCGLMRLVRGNAMAALESQALWHERDISHSSVERVIAPDVTNLISFALNRIDGIIQNLVVDEERLAGNLANAGDILYSQGVLLALVQQGLGRKMAYEMVQKAAFFTSSQKDFLTSLKENGILKHLAEDKLAEIFSSSSLLRHEEALFERARLKLREVCP